MIDCSKEGFLLAMDVSCWSFIRMAKLAEPLMKDGGTLSTMTYYGSQMVVEHYNMMGPVKAALEACVRYLAAELGPKGIRVHAISPGPLKTRAASGITDFDKLIAKAQEKAPSRRLVSIEDVGVAVAFLSMNGAKLITGETSLYRRRLSHHRLNRMDPRNYTASETLNDGTLVTIRAIRREDADAFLKAFKNLDRESVYRRFFSPKKELTDDELAQLTDVDFSRVVALLVTKQTGEGEVVMGGGRYATDNPDSGQAEIAFVTDGNYRGLGIASHILRHLLQIAQNSGVTRFEADVLAENQSMLAVLQRSGLPMKLGRDGGVLHVTLALQPTS